MKRKPSVSYQLSVNAGFTLIELLIVVVIFGIIGIIASNTLFALLRSATKTEILKEVKQNGEYATSVMEQRIRNAIDVVTTTYPCDASEQTGLEIINPDDTHTIYSCVDVGTPVLHRLQEEMIPAIASPPPPNFLTNSSVTLPSCAPPDISFTCTTSGITKVVTINFTLSQITLAPTSAESASQTFSIQVGLRNH